ncbi:hypothetical protein [Cereibacter sphaeroides]|uniref:hypothetical protein n=1 Tax=Cereibacter sphaeroides TaxID=1063 RepID=UPI001F19A8BB|nr:hypothetical protein [Cereibacter sphaeroides]MCE6969053.1 hypothetical protein [Cereibacter sphaeroides]
MDYGSDVAAPSADDLFEMLGYREDPAGPGTGAVEATPLNIPWTDAISARAREFIVRWETGGRAFYEQVIKARPVWPEFASGITIGCGYDLGYHTADEFRADWEGRIPGAAIERLAPVIGFRTDEPNRPAKVVQAKALVRALSDITVPWEVALRQFDDGKMPKLVSQLFRSLDHLDRLHPHARGALLSLVFNRGSGGFSSSRDRFREMREIARLMSSGRRQDIERIPGLLREMTRIWGDTSSLSRRRREEAELFEAGLAEERLTEGVAALRHEAQPEAAARPMAEQHEDVPEQSDTEDLREELPLTEAAGPGVADVRWNPNDDDHPDYRHLSRHAPGESFDLLPEDLEALIRFNAFLTRPGLLVFALRGARIAGADKREDVRALTLVDQRPDHRDYRCVIGVLDREARRIWAYRASTVPEAKALVTGFQKAKQGVFEGNMLPTGCYTYTVGIHRAGTSGEIRGVLRLATTSTGASEVIALRSIDDVTYDRRDFWHRCAPADNIHPGRRREGFSSLGCLTLPGDYDRQSRTHSGLWADFRVALGMGRTFAASDDGRQFSTVVLTGADAALVARLRQGGELERPEIARLLMRLRFGSTGPAVARLQEQLGLEPDPQRLIGPVTRAALIALQQRRLGWADGILSPEMEAELGLRIFDQGGE